MRTPWIAFLGCFLFISIASAASPEDEQNVRLAFQRWQEAFNVKDSAHVCDLFSTKLRWVTVYPGYARVLPEKNYQQICTVLNRTIKDSKHQFRYSSELKEVVVSENLAVVSVVWTLNKTTVQTKKKEITKEISLDIMEKQPDGITWKMIRFMAYEI